MTKKTAIAENAIVPILGDGAIAQARLGQGRLIPLLILDCSHHLDLRDMIYIHERQEPGDVLTSWGTTRFEPKFVYLHILFLRGPTSIETLLRFDVVKHAALVDGILQSRGVFLQPHEPGTPISVLSAKARILVEVSAQLTGWNELLHRELKGHYKKLGLRGNEAATASSHAIERLREMWRHRVS